MAASIAEDGVERQVRVGADAGRRLRAEGRCVFPQTAKDACKVALAAFRFFFRVRSGVVPADARAEWAGGVSSMDSMHLPSGAVSSCASHPRATVSPSPTHRRALTPTRVSTSACRRRRFQARRVARAAKREATDVHRGGHQVRHEPSPSDAGDPDAPRLPMWETIPFFFVRSRHWTGAASSARLSARPRRPVFRLSHFWNTACRCCLRFGCPVFGNRFPGAAPGLSLSRQAPTSPDALRSRHERTIDSIAHGMRHQSPRSLASAISGSGRGRVQMCDMLPHAACVLNTTSRRLVGLIL